MKILKLANNWSDLKQELVQPPCTVAEAANRLLLVLTDEEIRYIAGQSEETLIDLHFSLGLIIRNAWLSLPDSPLLVASGKLHPDDASFVIIQAFWERLIRT